MGDKLFLVDEQTAENFYILTSFLGLAGFFLSTIAGSVTLVYCSLLSSDSEFMAYVSQCGYLWKVCIGTFFLGFFSFIISKFWLVASLLGPGAALALAVPSISVLLVVLFV